MWTAAGEFDDEQTVTYSTTRSGIQYCKTRDIWNGMRSKRLQDGKSYRKTIITLTITLRHYGFSIKRSGNYTSQGLNTRPMSLRIYRRPYHDEKEWNMQTAWKLCAYGPTAYEMSAGDVSLINHRIHTQFTIWINLPRRA